MDFVIISSHIELPRKRKSAKKSASSAQVIECLSALSAWGLKCLSVLSVRVPKCPSSTLQVHSECPNALVFWELSVCSKEL